MKLLIWGAGAIGGTIGAYLVRAGHDITFVDRAPEHVQAIQVTGLQITGPIEEFTVQAPAFTPDELQGQWDTVLLCTKAQDTRSAARALAPHLSDSGSVVSVQNGLNALVLNEEVGAHRVLASFVNFGADYLEPGVIHYGGHGAVVIGEQDGQLTPRARALHTLLRQFEPNAVLTPNINGYLWSKLAYGALLFATALTNDGIADALNRPEDRELYIALAQEVLRVADVHGVTPEAFNGFDPAAFTPGASVAAARQSMQDMVVHNRKSAKTHSGIWRDLAIRKRRTEVDAQVGWVVHFGEQHQLPTPISTRLIELIHDIEEGRRDQSRDNLAELHAVLPNSFQTTGESA
ncbi:ketopantoate reductase family protein [Deinococcus peraridilitoris]|uniref:2-dehydropantoate 2-reductase n=1 Tax=Deinococcus peraridilitoris (strain DSM 19664 / LMG 22246 / CIP 109416 / KR-200) TaxID=937777 RepID=L0A9F1_DEIPD|nr:ketopantoate reductase family protein [Deinococcus peraridilitoris]AFZ69670.1 2-dehydropantoate 2-reductase [Deinococcus peraridilitoris DSM 19664]